MSHRETRLRVGDPLPRHMGILDMCQALGVSRATFDRRERMGTYADLEVDPPRGPRKVWSGVLVQQWLDGQSKRERRRPFGWPRSA